jgi:hypothetical protein
VLCSLWGTGCVLICYLDKLRLQMANVQSCSSSYTTVSKNHCLSTLYVVFVCGCEWASLPVCINNNGSAAWNFQPPAMLVFFTKMVLSEVVYPLKIHQRAELHCPTLTSVNIASTSEGWSPPFWNGSSNEITKYDLKVFFNVMISLLNFIKLLAGSEVDRENRNTRRYVIRLLFSIQKGK